jgi:hypothetical protein
MGFDHEKAQREVQARYDLCHSYIEGVHLTKSEVKPHLRAIMKDALDRGYRVWSGSRHVASNPFMLAKSMRNERGDKLYQIVIDFWDLAIEYRAHTPGVSLSPSSQFYIGDRRLGRTVDVDCFTTNDDTLNSIEEFYADFYYKMGCVPYETLEEA